jgi:hypothetical protein
VAILFIAMCHFQSTFSKMLLCSLLIFLYQFMSEPVLSFERLTAGSWDFALDRPWLGQADTSIARLVWHLGRWGCWGRWCRASATIWLHCYLCVHRHGAIGPGLTKGGWALNVEQCPTPHAPDWPRSKTFMWSDCLHLTLYSFFMLLLSYT